MSVDTLRRVMESMAERSPTTLYSPDRYALQVVVPAARADEALRAALDSLYAAQNELHLERWELVRGEVLSEAEFEEDTVRWNREIETVSRDEHGNIDDVLLRHAFHIRSPVSPTGDSS